MAKKERGACEKLALELAGIDAALTVLAATGGPDAPSTAEVARLIAEARRRCEQASDHLVTIRFHLGQLVP